MALKSYRFALGTADRPASGIWRLWVQEDEIHLQVHATHQAVEFTAYRTGRWRIVSGDAVSRWTRPKEFRPGWTQGPDLVVPASIRPLPVSASATLSPEPITWLPIPAAGAIARFQMFFASPRSVASAWRPPDAPGTIEIAALTLRTAGALHLCRRDEANDDPESDTDGVGPAGLGVRISADHTGVPSLREYYQP